MKRKKQLSALEWEVINIIWTMPAPVSVRDVMAKGYPGNEKAYTTVQTVMNNLVDKGFLKREKTGLVNFYSPAHKKRDILKQEVRSFADKAFGGSLNALVNFMIDTESLSEEEIRELKNLIEDKENGNKKS
ncbi:MAG: BlaI/MecI/CopY family transcriptional regulator [Calditrichia bacterium]